MKILVLGVLAVFVAAVSAKADTTISSDSGSNYTTWTNGANAGSGWGGPWQINEAARGGTSIVTDSVLGQSFAISAGSDSQGFGGRGQAFRPFASPLTNGDKLFLSYDSKTYGDVYALANSSGTINFFLGPGFIIGDYYLYDADPNHAADDTGIKVGTPIGVEMDIGPNNTYHLALTPLVSGSRSFSLDGDLYSTISLDGLLIVKEDDNVTTNELVNNLKVTASPEPSLAFLVLLPFVLLVRRRVLPQG